MTKSKQPILISYPSGDQVHADFCARLSHLCLYSAARDFYVGVHNIKTTEIDIARGMQAWEGLQLNASHILFLDSDMSFPPETLARLMVHKLDIVGVTYCQRRSPRGLTHESLYGDYQLGSGVVEVKSLGFGCILIRTEVFRTIPRPWFQSIYLGGVDNRGAEKHRSEDRAFCDRARQAGYRVWCDAELSREVRHCGQFDYGLEHAEIFGGYLASPNTSPTEPDDGKHGWGKPPKDDESERDIGLGRETF